MLGWEQDGSAMLSLTSLTNLWRLFEARAAQSDFCLRDYVGTRRWYQAAVQDASDQCTSLDVASTRTATAHEVLLYPAC